jgi:hypothetical protein
MAVPLMSARRPTAFGDVFAMCVLKSRDVPVIRPRSQDNSR